MNRDVCEHFNPVGLCDKCKPFLLCQRHMMHYTGEMCEVCKRENLRSKKLMMEKMRRERKRDGLLRCEFWLTPEQKDRVFTYVARVKRDV